MVEVDENWFSEPKPYSGQEDSQDWPSQYRISYMMVQYPHASVGLLDTALSERIRNAGTDSWAAADKIAEGCLDCYCRG